MNIVSFNCYNFKSNKYMISKLIESHDICFFIEHWLGDAESHYFNQLSDDHSFIVESDFANSAFEGTKKKRGRPFGGRCWAVRNNLTIVDYSELSHSISKITVVGDNIERTCILGIWQPFDDQTPEKLALLHSTLSILASEVLNAENDLFIIGDFNADFNRNKRFDKLFDKFISEHNVKNVADLFDKSDVTTYHKGTYSATLDHICCNESALDKVFFFDVLHDASDTSDHQAVSCSVRSKVSSSNSRSTDNNLTARKKRHIFPWKNAMFQETYAAELDKILSTFDVSDVLQDVESKVRFIMQVCEALPSFLFKAARKAEKLLGIYTANGLLRGSFVRCRFSSEIMNIVAEIKYLVKSGIPSDSVQIQFLKRDLRRLQRCSLYNQDKSEALRLDRLLDHDKPSLWRRISNNRKLNNKKAVITSNKPSAQDFVKFYSDLFSHNDRPSSSAHKVIEEKVQHHLSSLSNLSSASMFSIDCISRCIEKLKNNKSPGFDDVSNEFLKSGMNTQLTTILRDLFNVMLSTGFVPDGFNTSILVPIPKKCYLTAPGDYRPISISS